MKPFHFKSLTMRIWVTFTVIILVIICSISFLYVVAFRYLNEKAKIDDLTVAHNILLESRDFNYSDRLDQLKNLRGSIHFIYKVYDDNTSIIIDIKRKASYPRLYISAGSTQVGQWITGFITDHDMNGTLFKKTFKNREYIFIISSLKSDGQDKAYLISYLPNYQDNILLYTVFLIGLLFIAVGFFAARLVANRIAEPLKELEEYTIKIAHKDWNTPAPVQQNDEVGRLAKSMITMKDELKRAEEEEKSFLQSISHDLKTPVMVIMSHAQGIIDGVYIESVEQTAEIIKTEALRLEKRVKQILYLNTLDYVLDNQRNTCIHLDKLLLSIISRFELINSSMEWELDMDEISFNGCEDQLQVAVENIIDNALRYARTKICVTLKKEEGFLFLEIFNDGPGIPEGYLDRIFDNLYKDKSGNFGLGLAISKKIIHFYNGELYARNKEDGVSFITKLPLALPSSP